MRHFVSISAFATGLAGALLFAETGCGAHCPIDPFQESQDQAAASESGRWAQFLGDARRSARSDEAIEIPPGWKPEIRWRRKIGSGYSGISVDGNSGVLVYSEAGQDWITTFDVADGREIWRKPVEETNEGRGGSTAGQLSTPAIADGRIFFLTATGKLIAFDRENGNEHWRHDISREFGAVAPFFGFATSPLVAGNDVFVFTGSRENQAVLSFDVSSGQMNWKARSSEIDNSSPLLAEICGIQNVVCVGDDGVFALQASDGKLLWNIDASTDGWATPLVLSDDRLLIVLENRLQLVRFRRQGENWSPEVLWEMKKFKPYSSFFSSRDGFIFGTTRDSFLCLDAETGAVRWEHANGQGSVILVGQVLFYLDRDTGILKGIRANPRGYQELFSETVFAEGEEFYSPPCFAGRSLYLRSHHEIVAIELPEK